ncbi:MAG: antibiotic biosynthesis monooxygenase [Actinomycetota bacterium]|nr:antibiotic biosynthesis monooxygenase [Actinomycetota bacterium]
MEEFVESSEDQRRKDPPATGVASRRIEPGREGEFEDWTSGILAAVKEFPGYLGSDVLRPNNSEDDEYRIIYRFDHTSNLKRWEESDERRRWLDRAEPLVREQTVHRLTGLETWFTLPSRAGEPAPPRYKMALVTWLAVFPTVLIIFTLFGPLLNLLPTVLRTLLFTLTMVTLMTYVIMPRMTSLFSFWLYPKD